MDKTPIPALPLPVHHHAGPCECEPTIAYIRVSKVGNRPDILSPEIQLASIVGDSVRRNKRIVTVVTDLDKSGRTFTKRSVGKVIDLISKGHAKSVSVWKWSRWGRNLEYSLAYIARIERAGGRVDSATEDIDQSTATGRFSRDMVMRVDQLNSDLIGELWQEAHAKRRSNGLPHTGSPRFGYVYANKDAIRAGSPHPGWEQCEPCRNVVAHFAVHPVEGPRLAALYAGYVHGESVRKMARDLTAAGFRTATGRVGWTPQSLRQMLDNGFGAGYLRSRSDEARAAQPKARNAPGHFDVMVRGAQPVVIDDELWQAYLTRRREQAALPPRSRSAVHALSGLLFCDLCARRMTTKYSGRNRQHQWVCTWIDTYHAGVSVSVSNTVALARVRTWIGDNTMPPDGDGPIIDEVARETLRAARRGARTVEQISADVAKANAALDKLATMCAMGRITDERFDAAKAAIEAEELGPLVAELAAVTSSPGERDADRPDYEAFGALGDVWDQAIARDSGALNAPLRAMIAYVVVAPASGRGRWDDSSARVDVVGCWEESRRADWLAARRRRLSA